MIAQEIDDEIHFDLGLILISEIKLNEYLEIRTALSNNNYGIIIKHLKNLKDAINSINPNEAFIIDYYNMTFGKEWINEQIQRIQFVRRDIIYALANLNKVDFTDVQGDIYLDRFFHYYLNELDKEIFYISPRYYLTERMINVIELYEKIENNLQKYNIFTDMSQDFSERVAFEMDPNLFQEHIKGIKYPSIIERELIRLIKLGVKKKFKFVFTSL